MMKQILKTKLFFLKVLYSIFNLLANAGIANKFFIRSKLYYGSAVVSSSVFNNSCYQSTNEGNIDKINTANTTNNETISCYDTYATGNSGNETITTAEEMPEFKDDDKGLLHFLSKKITLFRNCFKRKKIK